MRCCHCNYLPLWKCYTDYYGHKTFFHQEGRVSLLEDERDRCLKAFREDLNNREQWKEIGRVIIRFLFYLTTAISITILANAICDPTTRFAILDNAIKILLVVLCIFVVIFADGCALYSIYEVYHIHKSLKEKIHEFLVNGSGNYSVL